MEKTNAVRSVALGFVIIASMFVLLNIAEEVSATTYVVDNTGGTPYRTIGQVLAAASPNDVIIVNYGTGTYVENNPLIINIPLTIIGQVVNNQIPTVSASNSGSNVFSITAGYPTMLENLAITGAYGGSCSGVYSQVAAVSGSEVVIQDCRIYGNFFGVKFTSNSAYNVIDDTHVYSNLNHGIIFEGTNNKIDDCGSTFSSNTGIYGNGADGIYSSYLSNSIIEDSNIYDNTNDGIHLSNSVSNTIQNVEIWNNDNMGLYMCGTSNTIDGMGNRNIKDNNALFAPREVYINGYSNTLKRYTITQTNGGVTDKIGVQTVSTDTSQPNVIQDCEISEYDGSGSIGVYVDGGDNVVGSSTKIHDNKIGLCLGSGSASSMVDCDNTQFTSGSYNFYDNEVGIQVCCNDAVIRETYFYYSPLVSGDHIGVSIDNSVNDGHDADIDDCKFEKLDVGIEIKGSSNNYHSTIDDTTFDCMSSYGVYTDGYLDEITTCTFNNCWEAGIYMDGSYGISGDYLDITGSTFTNTQYSTTDMMHNGIYGKGVTYIRVNDCTFDGYRNGIWLDDQSIYNEISGCTFSDDGDPPLWTSEEWGQNLADVGIHLRDMSSSNLIDSCDFSDQSFAIGIEGCCNIDIFGDTDSYSTITDCGCGLYATHYYVTGVGEVGSTGRIRDYGTDLKVKLYGTESDDTEFTYKDLEGTTDYEGEWYSWTEET